MIWLFALLAALTLADHASTNIFLKRGMREGNQLLVRIIAQWGSSGLFFAKLASFAFILWLHVFIAPVPAWLLMAACIAYASAVCWNVYQIMKRAR